MDRTITGFRQDEEGQWVAELACGHSQHVRHDPPWQVRPWVTTQATREARIGTVLSCSLCDTSPCDTPPPVPFDPYLDARLSGLCADGAAEIARRRPVIDPTRGPQGS